MVRKRHRWLHATAFGRICATRFGMTPRPSTATPPRRHRPSPRTPPGATTRTPPGAIAPGRPQGRTRGRVGGRPLPPPNVPRWWGEAAWALGWAGLLVVTGLWVTGGGVPELTSLDEALDLRRSAHRPARPALLLVQVLLMARVPLVEQAAGRTRSPVAHRRVGVGSVSLMLAHIGTIIGYSGGSLGALLPTFWQVTTTMPGDAARRAGHGVARHGGGDLDPDGAPAAALRVLASVAPVRLPRRCLALPHQLWTGTDFLSSPLATAYWWTLWAVAVLAVLTFRVALPVLRSLRHRSSSPTCVRRAARDDRDRHGTRRATGFRSQAASSSSGGSSTGRGGRARNPY